MNWIDYEYPYTAWIVEVKYSGDIAIGECRCKDMPKDRENRWGFTKGFWSYEEAQRYARHVAVELGIPTSI
jgi:hypothetical protein